jgi:chloride channel 7
MENDPNTLAETNNTSTTNNMEEQTSQQEPDPESNSLHQPLLRRNKTLSSSPLALIGTKVSYIESLDYE